MLDFPNIDPIALQIGPLAIRWYALAYLAGVIGGFYYIKWLNQRFRAGGAPLLSAKALDDLMVYAVAGIILGGRLGYVFFYNASHFLSHPLEILQVWQGGMSFHGGMIGVGVAFFLFARRYQISYLRLMDYICAAAPIGLLFGRMANFINGELYGRVASADAPFAMIFPHAGAQPRHPSQLYEAGLEGLVLFVIITLLIYKKNALNDAGRIAGVFLLGYGASRFTVEFFREPDAHLGLFFFDLSMGQLLSVPMIGLGLWLVSKSKK